MLQPKQLEESTQEHPIYVSRVLEYPINGGHANIEILRDLAHRMAHFPRRQRVGDVD